MLELLVYLDLFVEVYSAQKMHYARSGDVVVGTVWDSCIPTKKCRSSVRELFFLPSASVCRPFEGFSLRLY